MILAHKIALDPNRMLVERFDVIPMLLGGDSLLPSVVAIEDLNVAGMLKNHKLARQRFG